MRKVKLLLFFVFFLNHSFVFTQNLSDTSFHQLLAFLNFAPLQQIADIGTGNTKDFVRIASHFPQSLFTLQDIDSTKCNQRNLVKYWKREGKHIPLSNLRLVIGDTTSTKLPPTTYDYITLFSCLHEFSNPYHMFNAIRKSLKKGASFFIFEDICYDDVQLICPNGNPYFKRSEFFTLLKNAHIEIQEQKLLLDDPDFQEIIFKCRFKEDGN